MRSPDFDPTAGERARLARAYPDLPLPVSDPTDARFGTVAPDPAADEGRRIVDPTDPDCGKIRGAS